MIIHLVIVLTSLVWIPSVHSQTIEGVCGETKGCFSMPSGCDPDVADSCQAFASWTLIDSNNLLINLQAKTESYVAIGFSNSSGMTDSDVYACTSNIEVVRSRNDEGRSNIPQTKRGVTEELITMQDGVLKCTFKRQLKLDGDADATFFDLSAGNTYTALLAWDGGLKDDGNLQQHSGRSANSGKTDFTVIEKEPLPMDGGCGKTKGCFSMPSGCDPDVAGNCQAFSSWTLVDADNLLIINLQAETGSYVAIGFSKSSEMSDSDVYACTSNSVVVRSRNEGHSNIPQTKKGVSEESIRVQDGVLNCTFKRELKLDGDTDATFFDLSAGNTYTALLAWDGGLKGDGSLDKHTGSRRSASSGKVDFTENSSLGVQREPLPKLHGCFMTLAWLGFASIGLTTARFFKKSLPGKICGKPSWFAIHRFCMVTVGVLVLLASLFIVIDVKGYLNLKEEGRITVAHTIIGTIVIVLTVVNIIMASFRPHPGQPKRELFNWAHWGVGILAHLLAGVTIMLGTSNREDQEDALLATVPPYVFWLVVGLVFFHLVVWLILTIVDLTKNKAPKSISMQDKADAHTASTDALDEESEEEPFIKNIIYGVYGTVVVVMVIVVTFSIGLGNHQG